MAGIILVYPEELYKNQLEKISAFIEKPKMQMHNKGLPRSKEIPILYISNQLKDSLLKNSENEKIKIHTQIVQQLTSDNVLGFIEGTDLKNEIVVVTAHYDHLGYDNVRNFSSISKSKK